MILTIGNRDNHPSVKRAEEVAEAWLEEFQKRNPNVVTRHGGGESVKHLPRAETK